MLYLFLRSGAKNKFRTVYAFFSILDLIQQSESEISLLQSGSIEWKQVNGLIRDDCAEIDLLIGHVSADRKNSHSRLKFGKSGVRWIVLNAKMEIIPCKRPRSLANRWLHNDVAFMKYVRNSKWTPQVQTQSTQKTARTSAPPHSDRWKFALKSLFRRRKRFEAINLGMFSACKVARWVKHTRLNKLCAINNGKEL